MSAATRALRTYRLSDGSPLVAEPIDATVAAELFEDSGIPSGKVNLVDSIAPVHLDGVAADGTLAARGTFSAQIVVPAGASADVATLIAPRKCRLAAICAEKGGNGGAGDKFEVRTAAGGVGNVIGDVDLNATAGTARIGFGDAVNGVVAEGATMHLRRVQATDGGCEALLIFHAVD